MRADERRARDEPLERALRAAPAFGAQRVGAPDDCGLAREIGKLPGEVARAALGCVTAGLAGVSLRVGVDFLESVPEAARVMDAEELRAWGEMGSAVPMADLERPLGLLRLGVEVCVESAPTRACSCFQVCGDS